MGSRGQIGTLREWKEKAMYCLFLIAALLSIISLLLICVFLFWNGIPALKEIGLISFLTGQKWKPTDVPAVFGILPMILATIYATAGAMLISVPIGLLTAVYFQFYCPKKLLAILKPTSDLLAGIPSVVYGFFGLMIIVPLIRDVFGGTGTSLLAAMLLLGIMVLPTIIGLSNSALEAVPKTYYENALALGVGKERSIFFVVVPAAKSGILTSILLGIGRAVGEAMAVVMVAGNKVKMPSGLLSGVRTLTANIVLEMGYASGLHREALFSTALVLLVFILLLNLLFSVLKQEDKA